MFICSKSITLIGAILLLALLAGCASRSRSVRLTGFLPEIITLKPAPHDNNTLEYTDASFQPDRIRSIYVAPVVTSHLQDGSPDNLDALAQRMTITLQQSLMATIEVVPQPAEGVPELHAAITKVAASAPLLNIHPATKITGLGLGGASVEAMILEPQSNRVLYAVAFSRQAAKRVGSGLTKWDDAHAVVQAWAQELAARFEQATTDAAQP